MNLYVATFPIMVSFLMGIVLPFYLGANLYVTVLIGFALALPILITYAVASSVMRRSGGDYVFIGRLLHPALGFGANFAFVVFNTLFLTSAGYIFCRWCCRRCRGCSASRSTAPRCSRSPRRCSSRSRSSW